MFQIDRAKSRIRRLEVRRFSELGVRECHHLPKRFEGLPIALGGELDTVQKDFVGLAGIRE